MFQELLPSKVSHVVFFFFTSLQSLIVQGKELLGEQALSFLPLMHNKFGCFTVIIRVTTQILSSQPFIVQ